MGKTITVNLAVTADTQRAKAQLSELQNSLQKLTANSANLHVGLDAAELQKASAAVNDLAIHLREATNVRTGTLDFSKLSQSIKASGSTLQEYGNQLLRLGPQGQQAFNQLAQSVAKSEVPIRRMSGLLGDFGKTLANTVKWQISSSMIHGIMGSIQHAVGYAQDLNESLNKIQIVTQQSDAQMAKFAVNANKAAQALSTTTTTYTDAALIYYQQGLSAKEVEERTNVTIKMANAAGVSAKTVSDQMTAVWNNFADGSKSLEYYADVMTALGAATASSTDEISAGLEKFAAVADTVGLSYENAAAALATITATTRQSADSVGTGLRTLFSRLQSVSLGKTLEDGVNLTKYSSALEKIGVSVLDTTGQLRSMDDILEDMGARWNQLNDSQKTALAQTVGGVRQYTTLIALMDNFDFYKQNQQVALNSEGTVQKQADTYAQGWEASQKRVKASAEAIYSDLINDKFFITLNNGFATVLKGVDGLIDGLGGLKTILPAIAALMLQAFGPQITTGMVNFASQLQLAFANPNKLQNERDSFLNTAARQQVGIFNGNQTLTSEEQYMVDNAKQLINFQQLYGKNQGVMTDHEKTLAKNELDRYSQLQQDYSKQYNQVKLSEKNAENARTTLTHSGNVDLAAALTKIATDSKKTTNADLKVGDYFTNRVYAQATAEDRAAKAAKYGLTFNDKNNISDFNSKTFQENLGKDLNEMFVQPAQQLEKLRAETTEWNGDLEELKKTFKATQLFDEDEIDGAFAQPEDVQAEIETFLNQGQENLIKQNVEAFAQEWNLPIEKVQEYAEAIQAAQGDQEKLKAIVDKITQSQQNAKNAVEQRNQGMINAQTIVSTAQAMMSLSSAASSATTFTNGLIDVFQGKGTASIGAFTAGIANLSSTVMMAISGFNALSKAIPALADGPWGIILTIASVAIPTIISIIDRFHENSEEKLQRLQTEAEDAETAAKESAQAYQNLLSMKTSHEEALNKLKDLTKGTLEYRDALIQANNIADELIEGHGLEYGKDWYLGENQEKIIKQESMDRISEYNLNKAENDQVVSYVSKAISTASLNEKKYDKQVNDALDNASYNDNTIYGQLMSRDNIHLANGLLGYASYLNEGNVGTWEDYLNTPLDENAPNWEQQQDWHDEARIYSGNDIESTNEFLQEVAEQFGKLNIAELAQTMLAEQNKIINPVESGLMPSNSALNNLLGYIIGKQGGSGLLGNDLIQAQLSDQYSSASSLQELLDRSKTEIEQLETSGISIESQYKTAMGLAETDKLPESIDESAMREYLEKYQAAQILESEFNEKKEQYTKLGISEVQLGQKTYKQALKMLVDAKKNVNDNNKDIYAELSDYVISQFTAAQNETLKLQSLYTDFDSSGKMALDDIDFNDFKLDELESVNFFAKSYGKQFGAIVGGQVLVSLVNSLKNGDGLAEAFRDIQPGETYLETMFNIKDASHTLNDTAKKEANEIIDSFRSQFGNVNLIDNLFGSEGFKESLKSIQKEYKKTGRIGADVILDLADSSDELAILLEDDEINAVALADALMLIEAPLNGINGIQDLDDNLLKALADAGELENMIAGVYSYIDNFSQERSIMDIGKFYSGLGKDIVDNFENGFIGDDQLLQAYEQFFGQDAMASYYADTVKFSNDKNLNPYQISDSIYQANKAQIDAIRKVIKDGNLSGMWDYYAKATESTEGFKGIGDLGHLNEYGQFVLNDLKDVESKVKDYYTKHGEELGLSPEQIANIGLTPETLQAYMEGHNVPSELAAAMISEYSKTNTYLGNYFKAEGFGKGLEDLLVGGVSSEVLKAYVSKYYSVIKAMEPEDAAELLKGIFGDGVDKIITPETLANLKDAESLFNLIKDALEGAAEAGDKFKGIINMGNNFNANKADYAGLKNAYESNNKDKKGQNEDFERDFLFKDNSSGYTITNENGAVTRQSYRDVDLKTTQSRLGLVGVSDEAQQYRDIQQAIEDQIIDVNTLSTSYTDLYGNVQKVTMDDKFQEWRDNQGKSYETDVEALQKYADYLQNNEEMQHSAEIQAKAFMDAFQSAIQGGEGEEPLEIPLKFGLANGNKLNLNTDGNGLIAQLMGTTIDGKAFTVNMTTTINDPKAGEKLTSIASGVQAAVEAFGPKDNLIYTFDLTNTAKLSDSVVIAAVGAALANLPEDGAEIKFDFKEESLEAAQQAVKDVKDDSKTPITYTCDITYLDASGNKTDKEGFKASITEGLTDDETGDGTTPDKTIIVGINKEDAAKEFDKFCQEKKIKYIQLQYIDPEGNVIPITDNTRKHSNYSVDTSGADRGLPTDPFAYDDGRPGGEGVTRETVQSEEAPQQKVSFKPFNGVYTKQPEQELLKQEPSEQKSTIPQQTIPGGPPSSPYRDKTVEELMAEAEQQANSFLGSNWKPGYSGGPKPSYWGFQGEQPQGTLLDPAEAAKAAKDLTTKVEELKPKVTVGADTTDAKKEIDDLTGEIEEPVDKKVTITVNKGTDKEDTLEFGSSEEAIQAFKDDYQTYLDLVNKKNSTADFGEQSAYSIDINNIISKWGANEEQFKEAGKMLPEGLAEGIKNGSDGVDSAGTETAESVLEKIKAALQIASPSEATKQMGQFLDEGLSAGMREGIDDMVAAAQEVAQSVLTAIQTYLNENPVEVKFKVESGYGLPTGVEEAPTEEGSSSSTTEVPDVDSSGMEDFSEAASDAKDAVKDVASNTTSVNTQATALGNNQGFHKFVYEAGAAGGQLNTAKKALSDMADKITKLGNSAESLDMQPFTGPILEASTTLQSFIDLIKKPEVKEGEEQPEGSQAQDVSIKVNDGGTIEAIKGKIEGLSQVSPTVKVTDGGSVADIDAAIKDLAQQVKVEILAEITKVNKASGLNNGNGQFARGYHSSNDYQGLAIVGELGPELMIHNGQPFLAGVSGRTTAYVEPGDTIYTAAQTQKILSENPTLQDIPGFSVGYGAKFTFGNSGGGGYGEKASKRKRTKEFEPERYHLITRQIAEINRELDQLDKLQEKAFGKNKLKAIDDQVEVTKKLVDAQRELLKQAEEYYKIDVQHVKDLGLWGELQFDVNGNIANFDALQDKYARAAAESEDEDAKEANENKWKAIQKLEETLDKYNDGISDLQDAIFKLQEEELERITTQVEQRTDYDSKNLDLIDHYLQKIEDDVYATVDAFQLAGAKIATINHQIASTEEGINKIFSTIHDQLGEQLEEPLTIEKFLALSDEERDNLQLNSEDMEAIMGYTEDLIGYAEDLEELKTYSIERLANGFDKLNEKLTNTIDLYEHYNSLYESIRDVADLQGTGITAESQALLKALNQNMLNNNLNNVKAQQNYYRTLQENKAQFERMLAAETDETVAKSIQEQIDNVDEMLRDAQEELLSLWQEGLQLAQDEFTRSIEEAVTNYNAAVSGMYSTLDALQQAYDRKSEIRRDYLEDYEKYYQLSKLERDINNTIDDLAASGMKNNKNLAKILKDVNDAQKSGAELSQYDLDILVKKYELEKARAELEEARDAKSIVRLQRDRSGNWGYVYTQDEDNIAKLEQEVENRLYELQKANDDYLETISTSMISLQTDMSKAMEEIMNDMTLSEEQKRERILDLDKDFKTQWDYWNSEMSKDLQNQGDTYGLAIDLYKGKTSELGDAFLDLNDIWGETILSQITGIKDLDEYKDTMIRAWNELLNNTGNALTDYQDTIEDVNKNTGTSTEDFMKDAADWITAIGTSSDKTTEQVKVLGKEMAAELDILIAKAVDWEDTWIPTIQKTVDEVEQLANELTKVITLMNEGIDLGNIYDIALKSSRKEAGFLEAPYNIDRWTAEQKWKAIQQYEEAIDNGIDTDLAFETIIAALNIGALGMSHGLEGFTPAVISNAIGGFQQQVEIHAEFPNATDHYEIEEAFNNLVNKATQYANTKTTGMEY